MFTTFGFCYSIPRLGNYWHIIKRKWNEAKNDVIVRQSLPQGYRLGYFFLCLLPLHEGYRGKLYMYKCYMSLFSIPQKYNYSDCTGTNKQFYKQCFSCLKNRRCRLYATHVIQISSYGAFTSSLFSLFPLHVWHFKTRLEFHRLRNGLLGKVTYLML